MTGEEEDKVDCYEIAQKIRLSHKIITPKDTKEIYVYQDGIYKKGEEIITEILENGLKNKATIYRIREVLGHLKRQTYIDREKIAKVPLNLICVKNGILNIETKKLVSHSSEQVFFNKLPVDFVEGAECPKFKKFLGQVTNKENGDLLKRFAGYCLRRDCKYKKALMLYGPGFGGKSTLLDIIRKEILGDENCTAHLLHKIEEDIVVVNLYGKIANISADIPEKELTKTSNFKAIVAGDKIEGRGLYQPPFGFVPYVKLIFSANKIPETRDLSDAFFERWVLVEFPHNFRESCEEIENYFEDLSEEEKSGILNWILGGLVELEVYGFADVNNVRKEWLRHSDSISAFREDCLIKGDDFITKSNLYNGYCRFCEEIKVASKTDNMFHRRIPGMLYGLETFHPQIDGKQVEAWRGIKWRRKI